MRWPIRLSCFAMLALIAPAQESCRELVLPDSTELAWRAIGWRTSFGAAALEADATDRPILLWVMNGHPLGCT